jgi:hypothetical protein
MDEEHTKSDTGPERVGRPDSSLNEQELKFVTRYLTESPEEWEEDDKTHAIGVLTGMTLRLNQQITALEGHIDALRKSIDNL